MKIQENFREFLGIWSMRYNNRNLLIGSSSNLVKEKNRCEALRIEKNYLEIERVFLQEKIFDLYTKMIESLRNISNYHVNDELMYLQYQGSSN